jgi:hypothetical protein
MSIHRLQVYPFGWTDPRSNSNSPMKPIFTHARDVIISENNERNIYTFYNDDIHGVKNHAEQKTAKTTD